MEYHTVIKRKEAMTHTTVWMNLENVTLAKEDRYQRSHHA